MTDELPRYQNNGVKPDLETVLEHYGFDMPTYRSPRGVKIKCAFHGDTNASAIFNEESQRFHCFACDMQGDSYQLVMDQEGLDFPGAMHFAVTAGWLDVDEDGVTLIGGVSSGQPQRTRRQRSRRKVRGIQQRRRA